MRLRALIISSLITAAVSLAADEPQKSPTALEFLKSFEPPYQIDRNPDRKYIPKGQGMIIDGGTRITIVRAKDGRMISVCYYGMNRLMRPERDGLLSFCAFSDEAAFKKPSFRLERGSEGEALLAKIMLTLPLRREYPELKEIVAAHKEKQRGEQDEEPDAGNAPE